MSDTLNLVRIGDQDYRARIERPLDIAIPLDFDGDQPRHFGAPPASAKPMSVKKFVGNVRTGGSCNCQVVTLVPHCNGTHTECVGHVTKERVAVASLARKPIYSAVVATVQPLRPDETDEASDPRPETGDALITAGELSDALQGPAVDALVVRTRPNGPGKRNRDYSAQPYPPYFSLEAIGLIVDRGIEHLLVDVPSIDRAHDEGKLSGHRVFWGMPAGATDLAAARRREATVTEMVFVPNDIPDGHYGLNLQIAPFLSDAAPSRPILYPLERR